MIIRRFNRNGYRAGHFAEVIVPKSVLANALAAAKMGAMKSELWPAT